MYGGRLVIENFPPFTLQEAERLNKSRADSLKKFKEQYNNTPKVVVVEEYDNANPG